MTMPKQRIYTVSRLNKEARRILESEIGSLWLKGEISNLALAPSGHAYFTIKDATSEIAAVRFKGASKLSSLRLDNGKQILAYGRLTIYEPRGRYQFIAALIQPAGLGALQLAFQQLKEKLNNEGLFDKGHKKPLPHYPQRIGIVTSPSGAAIRDILSIFSRRWPTIQVYIFSALVQGEAAAHELVSSITLAERFSRDKTPLDLLIISRGGGSLEDLAAFNDEQLARAIFTCSIPIMSAIGHEIDFTIADFVADLRAPTPSAAAELAVPDHTEVVSALTTVVDTLGKRITSLIEQKERRLQTELKEYIFRLPSRQIETLGQQLDALLSKLLRLAKESWKRQKQRQEGLTGLLRLSDPRLPLRRGYSLTFLPGSVAPLRDSACLTQGQQIETHLLKGKILSQVEEVTDT
ncbi:exodeoxyribonuclease VII large subunit [Candidatus Bipolaricaulota bacterium]|nr:exodeoxyribonuclease VII large subunit [Candidatus Bipolaricaulota bacterium]